MNNNLITQSGNHANEKQHVSYNNFPNKTQ